MLGQYLPLLGLLVLATLFAASSLKVSTLLAPRKPTGPKLSSYECGIVPTRETPERFPVQFFLIAMAFIIFDVEIILFYPYAIAKGGLGVFGLLVLLIFSFAVFESFLYLIGAGALEWGPASRFLLRQSRMGQSQAGGFQATELQATEFQATEFHAGESQAGGFQATEPQAGGSRMKADDSSPAMISAQRILAQRTARTTVRRVGLEGRWGVTASVSDVSATETDEVDEAEAATVASRSSSKA